MASRSDLRRRCELRRALRGDSGAAAVELVVATPLLLLMVMGIVQFALWSHAEHVAQAAASQALAVARVDGGTATAGVRQARQLLDDLARGPLENPDVDVTRSATAVRVRISGTATAVVPFLYLPVRAEAAGPVEAFRAGAGP